MFSRTCIFSKSNIDPRRLVLVGLGNQIRLLAESTKTSRKLFTEFKAHNKEFINLVENHGDGSFHLMRKNRYLELRISNIEKKNAISGKMMAELFDKIMEIRAEVAKNDDLLALVIRGDGENVFASGADLSLVSDVLNTPEKGLLMSNYMRPLLNSLRDSPLIVLNYLNGFVVGGGAEMSTVGDFRIMIDKTGDNKPNFLQFIHAKIGASPGWGGGNRLTSIVGRRHALRLLGTSARISAEEAFNIGLVDLIHRRDEGKSADEVIEEFLKPYLNQPYPKSVRSMKRIVAAADSKIQSGISVEVSEFQQRWHSADNKQALAPKPDTHQLPKKS